MAAFGGDDQDRLLDEATAVVKEQAFYMKRAMDNDNLREALKHASNMICELRTSLLSPKNYYELYMQVFQEMQHLSEFFGDKGRHGRKMIDLYESVQHAGNILPRLYLLATVGASYIKSMEASAKEILKDMSELIKGVQHPVRGLFLRYYLSQMVKDKLPDTGTDYEEQGGGDITDAFDFILTNFMESNRLWVRIQHQGPQKDKARREKERHDLRVLVGANLVRMSQLEGMTAEFYSEEALPKILEHILSVKDTMSQQYLFESMIQVFPDELHIVTLEQELASYTKAQPSVDMKPIMVALMKRLSDYLEANKETQHALSGVDLFALFRTHLQAILERSLEPTTAAGAAQPLDIAPPLELQQAFMDFTVKLYPEETHYVDIILDSTCKLLEKYFSKIGDENQKLTGQAADKVIELAKEPLKTLPYAEVLNMENYNKVTTFLTHETRKKVCLDMVDAIVKDFDNYPADVTAVSAIFDFIAPLLADSEDAPNDDFKSATFAAEQSGCCKLIHCVHAEVSIAEQFQILNDMRRVFGSGGPKRLAYTLPGLVCRANYIATKIRQEYEEHAAIINAGEEEAPEKTTVALKKVFQFTHKTITALNDIHAETAFRLWLNAALVANSVHGLEAIEVVDGKPGDFAGICEEFFNQAVSHFEENMPSESQKMTVAIHQLIGALTKTSCMDEESYGQLAKNVIDRTKSVVKKPHKCRTLLSSAHLFWCDASYDQEQVMACLSKALKLIQKVVQETSTDCGLWVEAFDTYMHFFQGGLSDLGKHLVSIHGLADEWIKECANENKDSKEAQEAEAHLKANILYMQADKEGTFQEVLAEIKG